MLIRSLHVWVPIRSVGDSYEWADVRCISGDRGQAEKLVDECDRQIPQWAAHNPVVRIVRMTLTEEA